MGNTIEDIMKIDPEILNMELEMNEGLLQEDSKLLSCYCSKVDIGLRDLTLEFIEIEGGKIFSILKGYAADNPATIGLKLFDRNGEFLKQESHKCRLADLRRIYDSQEAPGLTRLRAFYSFNRDRGGMK